MKKILIETKLMIVLTIITLGLVTLKITGILLWGWTAVFSPVLVAAWLIVYILRELKKYDIRKDAETQSKA